MDNLCFTSTNPNANTLVVFFSSKGFQANGILKKGNTEMLAIELAQQLKADTFKLISSDNHYPDNVMKLQGIAKRDMKEKARPNYVEDVPDFSKYKTIFIGGPAWYMHWPLIVDTFIEHHDMQGKTLVPFMTYVGTSGVQQMKQHLIEMNPGSKVREGFELKGAKAQKMTDETKQVISDFLSAMEV